MQRREVSLLACYVRVRYCACGYHAITLRVTCCGMGILGRCSRVSQQQPAAIVLKLYCTRSTGSMAVQPQSHGS